MREADRYNALGNGFREDGLDEKALEAYDRAIALDPSWSNPWYNKGLLHKYAGNWRASFDCNLRAHELAPKDEAAAWNLGIAATALKDWRAARMAWKAFGIDMEISDEEIRTSYGMVPVRLNPGSDGEVVWGERIDPARVIIDNIPYPESGFRYKDIVLHDGAPAGKRMVSGREYSVFNVLGLFQASAFRTWTWEPDDDRHIKAVEEAIAAAGGHLEIWTRSVRILCKKCSEGAVHDEHDGEAGGEDGSLVIGVASPTEEAVAAINRTVLADQDGKIEA